MPSLILITHPIISLPNVKKMVALPSEFNDTKQKLMKVVRCHPQTGFHENQHTKQSNPPVPFLLWAPRVSCVRLEYYPPPLKLISPGKNSPKYQYLRVSKPRRLPTNMLAPHFKYESRITSLHQKRQENRKEIKVTQRKDTI